ncbi:putative metallo-hydrolase YflN [Sporomusa carbonis]|uniref:MBL fold metallo-hydrolase n=1 Tax=Sporomusa carbonis TaxID=3076075 RepID=UPI003A6F8FA0
MKLNVNYKILTLDVNNFGTTSRIHPVLIWDGDGATLVDAGYPGQFEPLRKAVEQEDVPFTHIRRVIITHQDWDHIGTLPDILRTLGSKVEIYAHSQEKPYLEGSIPYIKTTPERIAARLRSLPENMRAKAAAVFAGIPTARVHRTIADGEILPFHGGLQVIHTPGHTPGHVCLLLKSHRLLIAGDQLRVEQGFLVGPAEEYTPDMVTALASLKKLVGMDIDGVSCYHGGFFGPNASERIAELAAAGNSHSSNF